MLKDLGEITGAEITAQVKGEDLGRKSDYNLEARGGGGGGEHVCRGS